MHINKILVMWWGDDEKHQGMQNRLRLWLSMEERMGFGRKVWEFTGNLSRLCHQ
jgi:hypothetical protein